MWIERIAIENFLAFRELSVGFDRGFNVVLAPNEGGKSSLLGAIVTALFTGADARSAGVKSLARWGSRELFRLEISLELGGLRYRLARDFSAKQQEIGLEGESKPIARGKAVDAFLAERLPIADRDLFLRVCAVRHEELARVGNGDSNIGEQLEEMLAGTGGRSTPALVAKAVEGKRKDLMRGIEHPAKEENWGSVKRFSEELSAAGAALSEAREASRRREALSRRIAARRGAFEETARALTDLVETRDRAVRRRDLAARAAGARARADELRKKIERMRDLSARREETSASLGRLPEPLRVAEEGRLGELRAALERESVLGRERGRPRVASSEPARWLIWAGLALVAAGAVLGLLWHRAFFGAAAAGVCLVAWYAHRRRVHAASAASSTDLEDLERLRGARAAWSAGASPEEARSMIEERARLGAALRDLHGRIEEASEGAPGAPAEIIERLDAAYGGAALEARAIEEQSAALEAFSVDAQRLLAIEREIGEKGALREKLRAEIEEAERERAAVSVSDVPALAERAAAAEENLGRAKRRASVLALVAEALDEARRGVSGTLAERLPPLAARHLSRLTGGRYEKLFFDPRTLVVTAEPAATDGERGAHALPPPERIDLDALSQGARDLAYLAVRLALVDLIGGDDLQPLFLDDPFVHLDPVRRERALDLVREFAGSHQVILFTCDPAYESAGARVLRLGA